MITFIYLFVTPVYVIGVKNKSVLKRLENSCCLYYDLFTILKIEEGTEFVLSVVTLYIVLSLYLHNLFTMQRSIQSRIYHNHIETEPLFLLHLCFTLIVKDFRNYNSK